MKKPSICDCGHPRKSHVLVDDDGYDSNACAKCGCEEFSEDKSFSEDKPNKRELE